jgi:ubiquinone/menaquinone biosynthesis C-methylase UbiE
VTNALASHFAADVTFHTHSCTTLPAFKDRTIDVVFASNLFEHLTRSDLVATLSEIERILKPGGTLIVLQPNFRYCGSSYFDDYTHIQIFTEVSLSDLLAACGFHVVAVRRRFLPTSLKSRLPTHHLLVRAYLASPVKPLAGQMLVVACKPS